MQMGCCRKWTPLSVYAILLTVSMSKATYAHSDATEDGRGRWERNQHGFVHSRPLLGGYHSNASEEERGRRGGGGEDEHSTASPPSRVGYPEEVMGTFGLNGTGVVQSQNNTQGPFVLDIIIISSRRQVLVKVDDRVIFNVTSKGTTETEEMKSAGLYFAVLNQHDGKLIMARVIDMYSYANGNSLGFPALLSSIAQGRIMIFAIKTEAALNMPRTVRRLMRDLGATAGYKLSFRRYWAWVVTAKGPSWGEAIDNEKSQMKNFYGSPILLSVSVPLDTSGSCWDASHPRESLRRDFCRIYDGYGSLCECHNPAPLTYPIQELENSAITDVPVGIVAKARSQALYRCLVTVLNQKGGSVDRLIVLIDGHNREIIDLLHLFGMQYRINDMEGQVFPGPGARISIHYRFALHAVFSAFPNASKAIILEEDLLVAPDFFSYFNQTSWLLDVDSSIFCVSAWNDLGALHIAHHPHRLYRVETHAGYGWMLTRQFFLELYPNWKSSEKEHDWDVWLRSVEIRAGRECVIPDVSRTFHNSATGAHIKGILTMAHFAGHSVTNSPDIQLHHVERIVQDVYEQDLYALLESNEVYFLNTTRHPCNKFFLPRNFTDGPVVIFMAMDSHDQHGGWKKLGSCLGTFNMDTRAHHRGLFRFNFYDTELLIIGYPFSDYSYLKPPWVHVTSDAGGKEMELNKRTLMNRVRFRRPELEVFSPFLMIQPPTPVPVFRDFFVTK